MIFLVTLATCHMPLPADKARAKLRAHKIDCQFWAGTELDERSKRHEDILRRVLSNYRPDPTDWLIPATAALCRPATTSTVSATTTSRPTTSPAPSCWPRCGSNCWPGPAAWRSPPSIQVQQAHVLHGMGGIGKSVLAVRPVRRPRRCRPRSPMASCGPRWARPRPTRAACAWIERWAGRSARPRESRPAQGNAGGSCWRTRPAC